MEKNSPFILLIEDNPFNQAITQLVLQNLAYQVSSLNSKEAALKHLKTSQQIYDLVLIGINLSKQEGMITAQAIRQFKPLGKAVPIIAMTQSATQKDRQDMMRAGIQEILLQPLVLSEFKEILAKHLNERCVLQSLEAKYI